MNKKMFTKLFALVLAVCAVFSLAIVVSSANDTPTAFFAVPDGVTAPDAISGTTVTMPAAPSESAGEGYSFVGWVTDSVEDETSEPTYYSAGATVELENNTVFYALYSKTTVPTSTAYEKVTSVDQLNAGDKVVFFANCSKGTFVAGSISSQYMTSVSSTAAALPSTGTVLTLGKNGSNWTFTDASTGKLLGATAVKKLAFGSGTTTWTISFDASGNATIQSTTSSYGRFLYNVNSPRFTTYTSNTSSSMVLPMIYKAPSSTPITVYTTLGATYSACEHTNTTTDTVEAKCTVDGSVTVICDDCGTVISTEVLKALGHTGGTATCEAKAVCEVCGESYGNIGEHNFVDGTCGVCGEEAPSEATIDFSTTTQRESQTTESQVWKTEGLVFTNNKASGSDIINSSNPVRLYKNSEVVIKGVVNISKIVFTVNSSDSKYLTALQDSIGSAAVTVGQEVTVKLDGSTSSYTVTLSGGQVRLDSITVYFATGDEPVCEHENVTTTTVEATCYVAGSVVVMCDDCGEPVSSETIPAAHKFADGVCSACNVVELPKTGVAYKFGMYQSTKDTVYYINGEMSNYYMSTVTNASAGVYVYLEEATGGYYMYTYMNGVKTYINMVVSGTYVNAKYQTEASTVYTYDANMFAVCASVNGSKYFFGTYSTYTTIGTTKTTTDHITRFYATEQPAAPKFDTASVKLGTDLAMIYTVTVPAGAPTMTIEFNGKTVTIEKFTAVDNDTFTFTFDGIGPQQMALNIKATLNVNGEAVAEFDKYSVEKNLNNIKNAEGASAELVALVNSVLIYGDASENYVGFEGGVDASALENNVAANDATYTLANAETFGFTAAGVNFDAANKIYVKFYVEGEFTLTVNGTAVAVEAAEDGNYKVYTDALTATQFADTYTFVITVGEETATLTYSVNAYAAAMQNDAEMGALAAALYAYGVNAKAYAA